MQRAGLAADSTSMRAVGYRQMWAHLEGQYDLQTAIHKAKAATRQLAKRQLTWLRTEKQLKVFDPLEMDAYAAISAYVAKQMDE
jgi:tRNA dimethylallyltransferase